jgi:ferredoxin
MPIVSIQDTTKAIEVNEGEILYDSLYDRGTVLPHGCLSGSCGACRVEVISGHENLQAPGVIEQNTIDAIKEEFALTKGADFVKNKTIRLSCRAKVVGNVSIKPI